MHTQVVLYNTILGSIYLLSPRLFSSLPNSPVVLPGVAADVEVNVCVNTQSTCFDVYQASQSRVVSIQSPTQYTPVQVIKETLSIPYTLLSCNCRTIHISAGTK